MITKKRQRGYILTGEGLKKFQERIYKLEATKGVKYSARKIAELSQLKDPIGLHPTTVRKVLRQEAVDKTTLEVLFSIVELQLGTEDYEQPYQPDYPLLLCKQDWGEAVDVSTFYGRQRELQVLQNWILQDNCRLISVLGMGGVGKTTLVTQLAHQIKGEFTYLIWRSLRYAPPLEQLLEEILSIFAEESSTISSSFLSRRISSLIEYLRQFKCLLILDNLETVFQTGTSLGKFKYGYENYGDFLERLAITEHQSSLLLTSREKLLVVSPYEGKNLPVRTLNLSGLTVDAGVEILKAKALEGTTEELQNLSHGYHGNPLALKIIATSIQTLFGGQIKSFLAHHTLIFNGIRELIDQQFTRLSPLEKQILFELTIASRRMHCEELQDNIFPPTSLSRLWEGLEFLRGRSLIEMDYEGGYILQPVMAEYLKEQIIEVVIQSIITEDMGFLKQHSLLKAKDKDYVRGNQISLLLKPITQRIQAHYGSQDNLEKHLKKIIKNLQKSPLEPGYIAGNILNFLIYMRTVLTGEDLSDLTIWQCYFSNTNLHKVDFSRSNLNQCTFYQIFDKVYSLAISTDGNVLATGHYSGTILLWREGELMAWWEGHNQNVWSMTFSPDNQILASGSFDGSIILWDLNTKQKLSTFKSHEGWVWQVTFSPDGKILASSGADGNIQLHKVKTGECLATLSSSHQGISAISFSPEGNILASGNVEGKVVMWNLHTLEQEQKLRGHKTQITSIAYSPDGDLLATSELEIVKLWNTQTGECIKTWQDEVSCVWSVAFSSDGQILAISDRQTIKLWDLTHHRWMQILEGYHTQVWRIVFSKQREILAGCDNHSIILWNYQTGEKLQTLESYTSSIYTVALSSDSQFLASGSSDCLIRLWKMDEGVCIDRRGYHQKAVRSVEFHPGENILASGGEDGNIYLWDLTTGASTLLDLNPQVKIWSMKFSSDGQWLASGGSDEMIRVWNVKKQSLEKTFLGHDGWILSVSFSPDGEYLASGGIDETVKIWHMRENRLLVNLKGHQGSVWVIIYSADGGWLVSGGEDKIIRVWNPITKQCEQMLCGHEGFIWSLAFSPDGQWLASSSLDKTIRVWQLSSGKCLQVLKEDTAVVRKIVFHPDGERLIGATSDGSIKMWNLKTSTCGIMAAIERPYEGMKITQVAGLTESQKRMLHNLGAIESLS